MLLSNCHTQAGLGHKFDVESTEEGWSQGSVHKKALAVEEESSMGGSRRRCSDHFIPPAENTRHVRTRIEDRVENPPPPFLTERRAGHPFFSKHSTPCTHAKLRFTDSLHRLLDGASGQSVQQRETSDLGERITDRDLIGNKRRRASFSRSQARQGPTSAAS
jgi:hypothetical protein